MEKKFNWSIVWAVVLGFLFGLGVGYAVWAYNVPEAEAQQSRVKICHYTSPQAQHQWNVLRVAESGWNGHDQHDRDYLYEGPQDPDRAEAWCANNEPEPEVENSISIDRPGLECGVNYVTFQGNWTYKWDGRTMIKFFINGREPEVRQGDGTWSTGELTLAPGDYKIRAELWGYWQGKWHLKTSQDGRFTIEECPVPTETPIPTPVPTEEPKHDDSAEGSNAPETCTASVPENAQNVHVYRKGGSAEVKWDSGLVADGVNIYYYENQDTSNAHSVINTDNDSSEVINGLGGKDWTFGVQALNGGCAGSDVIWVIDGNTPDWVLFR